MAEVKKESFTRFEKARILGARSLQIAMGAKSLVQKSREIDPILLAKEERDAGLTPIKVVRNIGLNPIDKKRRSN